MEDKDVLEVGECNVKKNEPVGGFLACQEGPSATVRYFGLVGTRQDKVKSEERP